MMTKAHVSISIAPLAPCYVSNALTFEREVQWFQAVLDVRIQLYFEQACEFESIYDLPVPSLISDESPYAKVIKQNELTADERLILILALLPHVKPYVLDTFFIQNKNLNRHYCEFGGWQGINHRGFLPTCETAVFLLAGNNVSKRFEIAPYFEPESTLISKGIILVESKARGEPFLSARLMLNAEYLYLLTSGETHKPELSMAFPAKRLTTKAIWSDLILSPTTMIEVNHLITWVRGATTILNDWGLDKVLKPGYRALFYGPPGTGKTLTASLIGGEVNADVYRVDLSSVVSKYIGETEKNLASLFNQAETKNWILFFDEADALFGKRTQTTTANDRHSNQEIAYLLQRIEDFPGVVILATNLKGNIDEAFSRRFQSMIHFSMPDADQRLRLWRNALSKQCPLSHCVDLPYLAENCEITGGSIINVVRHAAICALQSKQQKITQQNLLAGITKEFRKEGKTL